MPSIDNRVVEMRFDNKQFESGVKTSLSTLDKLKAALKLDGVGKGLEEIERSTKGLSFNGLSSAIDAVNSKFSVFGTFADQIIRRIADQVYDLEMRFLSLVKSMSVDQVSAGWNKYVDKTASVQTIMNATGKSIDDVNGYLDKLMWYSDETSFGFTEMTSALGQMTSSGGDINKIIPMLMGIGNATAFAGKGSAEFSRMIYNLNQSYGAGSLQYMDWKSLENAGVASEQLKQVFIDTGIALGKIHEGQVTVANFGTTLKDKWADTEVMEQAFGKFAEMTEKAYELVEAGQFDTASAAYDYLAKQYDGISITAAKAAQEAKSFTEAIDATKDAVSSGWMKTFELIFGNYEEAKVLWTNLANELWEVFASGAEDRNDTLQKWHDGINGVADGISGYTMLVQTLENVWSGVKSIIYAVKEALADIFPPTTAKQLLEMTEAALAWSEGFKNAFSWVGEEEPELVKPFAKTRTEAVGLKSNLEEVEEVAKRVLAGDFGSGDERRRQLEELGYSYEQVQNKVNELLGVNYQLEESEESVGAVAIKTAGEIEQMTDAGTGKANKSTTAIEKLQAVVRGLASAVDIVRQVLSAAWTNVIRPITGAFSSVFSPVIDNVVSFSEKITDMAAAWRETSFFDDKLSNIFSGKGVKNLENVTKIFQGFKSVLDLVTQAGSAVFDVIITPLLSKLPSVGEGLLGVAGGVGEFVTGIADSARESDVFRTILQGVVDVVTNFSGAIVAAYTWLKDTILPIIGTIKASILGFLSSIASGNGVTIDFASFREVFSWLGSLVDFSNVGATVSRVLKGVGNALGILFSAIPETFSGEHVLGSFSTILGAITTMNVFDLVNGLTGKIKSVPEILGSFGDILNNLKDALSAFTLDIKAEALMEIATAIGIMAASLVVLSLVDPGRLASSIVAIGVLMGGLAGMMQFFSTLGGASKVEQLVNAISVSQFASSLLKLGAGMLLLSAAVAVLASIDSNKLAAGVLAVTVLFAEVGLLARVMSKIDNEEVKSYKTVANSMISIGLGLLLMSASLKVLSGIDTEALGIGLLAITVMLGEIGLFAYAMSKIDTKSFAVISVFLGALSVGLLALTGVVAILGHMQLETLGVGLLAIGGILLEIFAFSALMDAATSEDSLLAVSASIVVFAAALAILAPAMKSLGRMNLTEVGTALLAIGGALAILGIAGIALEPAIETILGLSASLLLIGVATLAAGAGLSLMSLSLSAFGASAAVAATGIVTALGIIIVGIASLGEQILQALTTIIVAIVNALVTCIPTIATGIGALVVGVIQALITYVPLILNGISVLLGEILQFLADSALPLADSIIKILLILINDLAIAIVDNGQAIGAAVGNVLAAIGSLVFNALYGLFGPIIDFLFPNFSKDVQSWLDTLNSDTIDTIESQNEELKAGVSENVDSMKSGWDESMATWDPAADLAGNMEGLPQAAQDAIDGTSAVFSDGASETSIYGSDAGTSFISGLLGSVESGQVDVSAAAEALTATLGNQSSLASQYGGTAGTSYVTELFTKLQNGEMDINSVMAEITSMIDNSSNPAIGNIGTTAGEALTENMASSIVGGTGGVVSAADAVGSGAVMAIDSHKSNYTTSGMVGMSNYASGITSNGYLPANAANGVASSVISNLNSGNTENVGYQMIMGLKRGLQNNAYIVNAEAANVASVAIRTMKNIAQIKSPSRVTMEIGRYMSEGLAIGIDQKSDDVKQSSADISSTAIRSMSSVADSIGEAFDQKYDAAPTITPVVDLRNVTNGAKTISDLFGTQSLDVSANLDSITAQNDSIVSEIQAIRGDIYYLGSQISKLKVVMDNGALVGQIIDPIDSELAHRQIMARRRV